MLLPSQKHALRQLALFGALGALFAACDPNPGPPPPPPPINNPPPPLPGPPAGWAQLEDEIVQMVNDLRARGTNCGGQWYGPVGRLAVHSALRDSARRHSADMAAQNYFDHTGLDGRSPFDRIRDSGYPGTGTGENLAGGHGDAASTMDQWINSTGHCTNMMNARHNEIGVGYAYDANSTYRHYWTQNFGER